MTEEKKKPFHVTAKLVRLLRKKKGWTQMELAERLGYPSSQAVSNMERGVSGVPKTKIDRMAKLLEVKKTRIVAAIVKQQKERL